MEGNDVAHPLSTQSVQFSLPRVAQIGVSRASRSLGPAVGTQQHLAYTACVPSDGHAPIHVVLGCSEYCSTAVACDGAGLESSFLELSLCVTA
jgi:hypothetical protein